MIPAGFWKFVSSFLLFSFSILTMRNAITGLGETLFAALLCFAAFSLAFQAGMSYGLSMVADKQREKEDVRD